MITNKKYQILLIATFIFIFSSGFLHSQESDLDRAYRYLNTNQMDLAIGLFENHIKDNPSDMKIRLQLAYAYKQNGDKLKATEYFSYVAKYSLDNTESGTARAELDNLTKNDVKTTLDRAYQYLNTGNTTEAARLFEEYISTNTNATLIYLQLGYIYKQQGEIEKAQRNFQYVVNYSTEPSEIDKAKSEIDKIYAQKYTPVTTTTTNSYTPTTSSSGADDLNQAYSALNSGDYSKAASLFETYLVSNPDNTKIHLQLGYIYDRLKRYDKAIFHFDYVAAISNNRDEIDAAKQSSVILRQMNSMRALRSMDIYFYNVYDSYYQNYITNILGHINFNIGKPAYIGFYGDAYLDARSKKDYILNDRYVEAGGFLKLKFSENIALEMRLGYYRELDFERNGGNFKPILTAGTRLGEAPFYLPRKTFKTEYFYLDIYSTELYDSKFKNLFGQLQFTEVLRYMTGGFSYFEFYLRQMAQVDSRQLDYNNFGEFSIGLSFKPNLVNFPALFIEGSNRINIIGNTGEYFKGDMKSIFQFKAGFIINFNSAL